MTTKTTYQWPQSKDIYPYRPGRFDAPNIGVITYVAF